MTAVCPKCIEDPALEVFIQKNLDSEVCDYCERMGDEKNCVATLLQTVVEHMLEFIEEHWGDPWEEGYPYDQEDGEYIGETWTTEEVFEEIGFYPSNPKLSDDIVEELDTDLWGRVDRIQATHFEQRKWGWNKFCDTVMHQRRYTFWTELEANEFDDQTIPTSHMIQEIASAVVGAGLKQILPVGEKFWRLRVHHKEDKLVEAKDFSSPPVEYCHQANRMSPAGISMFYGAEDWETAYLETVSEEEVEDKFVSGGYFENIIDLTILDLSLELKGSSFFQEGGAEQQDILKFLWHFRKQISKPIQRKQSADISYVPSQVFTEFVRFDLAKSLQEEIHGIAYQSSKNGRKCFVLFFDQGNCIGSTNSIVPNTQYLEFSKSSLRSEQLKTIDNYT